MELNSLELSSMSRPASCPAPHLRLLPSADVVEAEVLNAEALLSPVETPQPLALQGASLALAALATPEYGERRAVPWVPAPLYDLQLIREQRLTVPPGHTSRSTGLWPTDRTDSPGDLHILPPDASPPGSQE